MKILVAETFKRFNGGGWNRCMTFTSFDRDKLKDAIEKFHDVAFVKDERDDFPYFTDGGFLYRYVSEKFELRALAYFYKVIE